MNLCGLTAVLSLVVNDNQGARWKVKRTFTHFATRLLEAPSKLNRRSVTVFFVLRGRKKLDHKINAIKLGWAVV